MKSVLISIKPKWCELIALGKKTVEIRKTKPKLKTPFKCYIYCALPPKEELFTHGCIREYAHELIRLQDGRIVYDYGMRLCCDDEDRPYSKDNFLCRKVIGEFVCDEIDVYTKAFFDEQEERDTYDIARLIYRSRIKYSDLCAYVGSKDFYAWHISDLVIYDKPRELSQFEKPRDYIYQSYKRRNSFFKGITRPPQSWCYVEE